MRYFSVCSGIGGFELGIQRSIKEAECVGFSEIDDYAVKIYQSHFNHKNYGDIKSISASALPDFDLLVGGFPCQSFSNSGDRKGFGDPRGTIFFDIARILKEKKPRLFLLENVKGLLSNDGGRTFKVIISTLDELGYDLQWQVLNSECWLPHHRERIFIVGHLRGTARPKVFPFGENDSDITKRIGRREGEVTSCLTTQYAKPNGRGSYVVDRNRKDVRVFYERSFALKARMGTGGNNMPLVNGIRRLTPLEGERLQGFPDNWTNMVSDTRRYISIGNAVTVPVIEAIAKRLI